MVVMLTFACSPTSGEPLFEVMLTDGKRLDGNRVESWHEPGLLTLDGQRLTEAGNHYRWIRNRTLSTVYHSGTRLELIGGDVIPGRALEYVDDDGGRPAHVVVHPLAGPQPAPNPPSVVRVDARYVRRVVWRDGDPDHTDAEAATAILLDGRVLKFTSAKLREGTVRLLMPDRVESIAMSDLAQLHMPPTDGWQAHFDHLAAVDPSATHRLERIETQSGMTFTVSSARVRAVAHGRDWKHVFQPAWSLEPITVMSSQIVQRTSFEPNEVPLSCITPSHEVRRATFADGNPWRLNRGVHGKPLISGGRRHGWGIGVHAYSELHFTLSPHARQFDTRMGLDQVAGRGGCVRARVFLDAVTTQPVYESALLVGSNSVSESSTITIPRKRAGHTLILQADDAHLDRPRGADPFDVRDAFNWLEPIVTLDPHAMRDEVLPRAPDQLFAWRGWTLSGAEPRDLRWTLQFTEHRSQQGRFSLAVHSTGAPIVLSREVTVDSNARFLTVSVRGQTDIDADTIRLEIDGRPVTPRAFPRRQPWQEWSPPIVFPVEAHQGQTVTFRLTQPGGDSATPLYWHAISLEHSAPRAYVLQDVLGAADRPDLAVNQRLGQLLGSDQLDAKVKRTLIRIGELGGDVNFALRPDIETDDDAIVNVLLGSAWKGGDQGCRLLEELENLPVLMVSADSHVSETAIARLQTTFPRMTVERLDRVPGGQPTYFEVRNRSTQEVAIYWISFSGELKLYDHVKPGALVRRQSYVGHRWEAHADGRRISEYEVGPILTWDIR